VRKILFGFVFFFGGFAGAQSLNDYSILLPLPSAGEMAETLGVLSEGASLGVLMPLGLIKELPTIVVGEDRTDLYENRLKVVSVRIDPCFFEGTGPLLCRPQIRMVWQPLLTDRRVSMAQDAALHSFYDLTDAQFQNLLQDLKPYSVGDRSQAMSIHPGMVRHGYASDYWRGLRSVLLKYAGEKNLKRITFMTVNPIGTVWVFGAFDVVDGQMVRLMVPRVNFGAQAFFVDNRTLREFRAQMNPVPAEETALLNFLSDSSAMKSQASESELQAVIKRAYEFENPDRHNPGTVDCVSCHIAQTVRLWGQFYFPVWKTETLFADVQYQSALNLKNQSPDPFRVDSLRAFGYFGSNPVISNRTINETAAVFQALQPRHEDPFLEPTDPAKIERRKDPLH
jgi:hypothetical protein